jgi:protein-L-isoaspartate(D-aspartate) O-methyltransferase
MITPPNGGPSVTDNPRNPWQQLTYTCDDWRAAESTAVTVLFPLLRAAQDKGDLASWWFVRKGPQWRVRLESPVGVIPCRLAEALTADGNARAVAEGTYEPETTRFGGPDAMDAAHRLFAADSLRLLDHLAGSSPRLLREIPVILATRLLRAARQDWYEQGDCWEQMAAHRSADHGPAPEADPGTVSAMLALLSAGGDAPGSPLHARPEWASAFEDTGRQIAALAGRGSLARGQRAVLAQHLLFLFNRHGVPACDQSVLAATARQAIFGSPPGAGTPLNPSGPPRRAATVSAVTATTDNNSENQATQLRNQLADWISGRGTFQTPGVERAFRTVSRHEFLPGQPLEDAYSRKPVVTQRAPDGSSTSSASSPNLVAQMLEQLRAEPGNTVLEIGAATGFNAALLACVTSPGGKVVTIEFDPGLADQATENLRRAGYPQVQVVTGDGALGHREQAPYDRIIVTAEATDVSTAWWDQLSPVDSRIVVPVRLHGSGLTRSLGLRRTGSATMVADSAYVCGFVAMRGSGEQAEQQIRLDAGAALKVDAADRPDAAALSGVLRNQPDQRWTGICVRDDEPAAHLDLWLLTMLTQHHEVGACFGRLSVTPDARGSGLADPALRWAGAGLYQGGALAWVTARPAGESTRELGIDARGPGAAALAETALSLLAEWDAKRPAEPVITATRASADAGAAPGVYRVTRPATTFTIAW